jgi:hypothetical protein
MCNNCEMKRVLYQGPTHIRRHHKKFSLLGDLAAGVSAMLYYTHYEIQALPSFHGTASNTYHSTFYILTLQGIHKMYITIIPLILHAITIRYNHTRILPRDSVNRERKTVCEVPTSWRHDEPNANIHKDFNWTKPFVCSRMCSRLGLKASFNSQTAS